MNFNIFKLYGLVCFFPIWIFRINFATKDILILIFLFLFLPILIHIQIFKLYDKIKPKIIYFWLSLITFYCFDQNLSLWGSFKNGFSIINFNSPYLNSSFYFIVSISFILGILVNDVDILIKLILLSLSCLLALTLALLLLLVILSRLLVDPVKIPFSRCFIALII